MKRKLLFAMLCIVSGLGLRAQTDVTSTYITNPSFESDGLMSAGDGTNPNIISPTGWTQEQNAADSFQNNKICDSSTSNSSNYGTLVTPSDGTYYLFYRHGWNGSNYAKFTSTVTSLPAGIYTLKVDYKMVSGSDNTNNNDNTSITLSAISGETTLATTTAKGAVQVNSNGTTAVLTDNDWLTLETSFTLESQTSTQIAINLLACGPKRSDFVVDNVKLLYTAFVDPTAIALDESSLSMIPTATKTLSVNYTPTEVNHSTAITWTSSNEAVATVSSAGVVTAVAAGTATITAATANSVSATCTVTVNEAPLANGDYYILNVSKGKYLGTVKNGWGTQAGVADHGIPFTATLANGAYTLDSKTYNSATEHFLTGTYVDGAATSIHITALGSGKYSLSTADNSAFLTANDDNAVVANTASDASSELAQWKFVTKAELVAAFASATTSSPVDATFYIGDPDFSRNYWPAGRNTSSWKVTASNKNLKGGDNGNMCAETYQNNGGTIYQTLTVPNGRYGVKCQGFYRLDSGSTPSYLYANDEKQELSQFNANDEGTAANMTGASTSFSAGLYQSEVLIVNVSDGSLTVGVEGQGGNWTCFDNFELFYYGPNLAEVAEELPEAAMTANQWYFFDITVDGEYDLTLTTLADIVETTDGTILVENQSSVTANFSGTEAIDLTTGRYYVKSASAQTLTVAPHTYTYAVGDATLSVADGAYTQNRTFTVTFPDAVTNDPSGEVALVASSKATVNGEEVALSAVTDGFSLDLGSLTVNTDYRIVIPANVYGYAGESMNAAIDITVHTPATFDGFYFLRTLAGKYVARGGDYNSRAIVDEFGLPLSIATNASGITQFTYVDNGGKLFLNDGGNAYTDNNTDPDWILEATEGGYYLVHANGTYTNNKLNIWSDGKSLLADATEGAVFVIEPVSEHNTYMEALKDVQAATAATAAGLSSITTKSALATELASNYNEEPVSVAAVSFTEKWNGNASAEWGAGKDMYTNTISELPEGLYKLTVNAYYRINGSATAAEGARGNTYLYGGSAKTQLYSLKDFPAAEAWSGRNQSDAAGYYPDDVESGTAATASSYLTELYVYHEGGDFTYGIHQPSRFSNGEWFGYQNFTLTRYTQTEANMTIAAGKYGTFVAPFDVTIPDGVTAEKVTGVSSSTLVTEEVTTTIPANTPVLVSSEAAVNTTFYGKGDAVGTVKPDGQLLTGVYEAVEIPAGSYVLQTQDGVQAFYKLDANATANTVNRAYLTVPASPVKAFFFNSDDADAIKSIEATDAENTVIYNLAGERVSKAQKGLYIQKGKKMLVK